ncbi:MAG: transcriptional regulator [Desulfovibrionales bacterium]
MNTIRQEITAILEGEEMTARELSQELGVAEREIYSHLPHIARSVASSGKRLRILPFRCLSCGFVFRERTRYTPPGRCPRCRETHLERPSYRIE